MVVDGHDMGMVQVGRRLGFPLEADHKLGLAHQERPHDLDGHFPV